MTKRWWCVEMQRFGQRIFVGRIEATPEEIKSHFGPYVELNETNGECFVYGRPSNGVVSGSPKTS